MNGPDTRIGVFRRTNSTPALTSIVEGRCAVMLPECWPEALTETRRMRLGTYASGMIMCVSDAPVTAPSPAPTPSRDVDTPDASESALKNQRHHDKESQEAPATAASPAPPSGVRPSTSSHSASPQSPSELAPASGTPSPAMEPTREAAPASADSDEVVTDTGSVPGEPGDPIEGPAEEGTATPAAPAAAYDPAMMDEWLEAYRDTIDFCPPGVKEFVHAVSASLEPAGAGAGGRGAGGSSGPARGTGGNSQAQAAKVAPLFGTKLPDTHPAHTHHGGAGAHGPSSNWGHAGSSGKNGLEAIEQLWEDRKDMPISMGTSLRRRGLFGDAEKKEIHHMVTAVLNKVTTDPIKFREVKNELLRLPIPEANAAQLDSVVDVFVHKAISEPDFSHSYADLLEALCKVPQGQGGGGDRTQTLEYRLRRAIVTRCQMKFMEGTASQAAEHARLVGRVARQQGVAPEDITGIPFTEYDLALLAEQENEDPEEADARTKELRDTMCGIVRFVSELYRRHMITANVLTVLFFVCLTGTGDGNMTTPPTYMPTESQLDEVITILHTAGKLYLLDTSKGRGLLPSVLGNLEYWMVHYPVSRTRFLLITEAATLQQWSQMARATTSPTPQPAAAPLPSGPAATVSVGSSHIPPRVRTALPGPSQGSTSAAVAGDGGLTLPLALAPYGSTPVATAAASPGAALDSNPPSSVPTPSPGSPKTGIPAPRSRVASAAAAAAASQGGGGGAPGPVSPPPVTFDDADHSRSPPADGAVPTTVPLPLPVPRSAGPVQTVRPPVKQPVRVAHVAELMSKMAKVAKDDADAMDTAAQEVAQSIEDTYGDALPCVSKWVDRCVTVAKEDKARQRTPRVLRYVLQTGAAPPSRDELRDVAVSALERAVLANIHEELHIFSFWAQMVMADTDRCVFDEEMLNEGLAMVLARRPSAAADYLADVGKLHAATLQKESYCAPTLTCQMDFYPRYRPLLWAYNAHVGQAHEFVVSLVDQPALRQQSLEIAIFCAIVTGQPSQDNIFRQLRESPRLVRPDPTLAAEIMSAVMMAEICCCLKPFLDNNIVLVQTVVDGVNRRDRERSLLAEAHHITEYAQCPFPLGCDARLAHKLVALRVVSSESAEEAAVAWERKQASQSAAAQAQMATGAEETASRSGQDPGRERSPTPTPPLPSGSHSTPGAGSQGLFPRARGRGGALPSRGIGRGGGGGSGAGSQGIPLSATGSFARTSSQGGSSDTNSNTHGRVRRGSGGQNSGGAAKGANGVNGAARVHDATGSETGGQPRGSQRSHGSVSLNSSGTGSRHGGSPAAAAGVALGASGGGGSGGRWGSFGSPKSTRSSSDTFDAVAASYRAKYLSGGRGGRGGGGNGERRRGGRGSGGGGGARERK